MSMCTNETKKTVHTLREGVKFLNHSFLTAQSEEVEVTV